MDLCLGDYLQQLRQKRGVALSTLARSAQVSRASLYNWESRRNLPRIQELEALLEALKVSEAETIQALSLIDAPRAQKRLQEVQAEKACLPLPHAGALLRMLRIRRGLTQERMAVECRVRQSTVARWERGEMWPGNELLDTICQRLQAHSAERHALQAGLLPLSNPFSPAGAKVDLDQLEAQLVALHQHLKDPRYHPLGDLYYLTMEAQAASLAQRSESGQLLLARLLLQYAAYLGESCQPAEAGRMAERALDLLPKSSDRWNAQFLAAEMFWVVRKYTLKEHAQLLKHWIDRPLPYSDRCWVLGQIANSLQEGGNMEAGLALSDRCRSIAVESGDTHSIQHQQNSYAENLLSAGRAAEAAELFAPYNTMTPPARLRVKLRLAEAHFAAGNRSRAHDWLLAFHADNALLRISYYAPEIQALEVRL